VATTVMATTAMATTVMATTAMATTVMTTTATTTDGDPDPAPLLQCRTDRTTSPPGHLTARIAYSPGVFSLVHVHVVPLTVHLALLNIMYM
jgi:hypothetical protein